MPNTTTHDLPYPAPTDAPDVPYAMQQLAEGVDAAIPKVASGTVQINLSSASSGYAQVDFSDAGFTSAPNIVAMSTNFSYYGYRAAGGTNDSNTAAVGCRHYANTNATATVTMFWIAVGT